MKKIIIGFVTVLFFNVVSAQQSNQAIAHISAPSCCPSSGIFTPGTTTGIWGWSDNGNSAGQLNYFSNIPAYTLTFIYAFPTTGSTMTHVRCTTESKKGYCGMQPGEWMVCRDQDDHNVGLGLPGSQHFYLSLLPYSIPSTGGGGNSQD